MLDIISSIFIIIGSIIGAGFASGKEIAIYFCPNHLNVMYLLFFTVVNVIFIFLCLRLGNKYLNITVLNKAVFKKCHLLFNCVLFASFLLFSASMLSVLSTLFYKISLLLFLSIFLCFTVVLFGSRTIKIFNFIVVPLLVVFILLFSIKNYNIYMDYSCDFNVDIFQVIKIVFYAAINLLLAFGSVFSMKLKSKKYSLIVSLTASVIISLLIFVISNAIVNRGVSNSSFPILELSRFLGEFSLLFKLLIWCSVMTTFCTCLSSMLNMIRNKKESKIDSSIKLLSLLIVSSILSFLGFDNIVQYGYMVLGFLAFIYFIVIFLSSSFRKSSFKQCNPKIH